MSCYHPLVGFDEGINEDTGKRKIKVLPAIGDVQEVLRLNPGSMLLPCGKCIGCRMDYSRKWADRMMLELESAGKGVFVTLTYDCRHVPDIEGVPCNECYYPKLSETKNCPLHEVCARNCRINGSLYKRHVQLFLKSLRKELSKSDRKIRFWCTGEYGDWQNTHRPHYHLILFGIGLDDLQNKVPVGFNELRQEVYTDPLISRHWPFGFVSIGDVSWRSCAYVSRYVTKKILDSGSDALNEVMGLNPIYACMSRRPGIGKPYLEEHPDCLDYQSIYLSSKDGAKKISIPRYFVNALESTDPEKYANMIAQRALYASNSMYSKLNQTDLDLLSYLEVEEKNMYEKIRSLKRSI